MVVNLDLAWNQSPEGMMYWHICSTCKHSACIVGRYPRLDYEAISSPITSKNHE
jgi:hypothetical protein